MFMSDGEICREYKSARRKAEQIRILADLNCTTRRKIIDVLQKGGVYEKRVVSKNTDKRTVERYLDMTEDELTLEYAQCIKKIKLIAKALEEKTQEVDV